MKTDKIEVRADLHLAKKTTAGGRVYGIRFSPDHTERDIWRSLKDVSPMDWEPYNESTDTFIH